MSEIAQGLIISGLGLGITFAALSLVILVITILTQVFRSTAETESASLTIAEDVAPEIIAAIAVALQMMQTSSDDRLGTALESIHSTWWKANFLPPVLRRAK